MNIITARRALRALQRKSQALETRRSLAKDKPRWDTTYGKDLHEKRVQQVKLMATLQTLLAEQGQYNHRAD